MESSDTTSNVLPDGDIDRLTIPAGAINDVPYGMVLTSDGDLHKTWSPQQHVALLDKHGVEVTWSATKVGGEFYPNR